MKLFCELNNTFVKLIKKPFSTWNKENDISPLYMVLRNSFIYYPYKVFHLLFLLFNKREFLPTASVKSYLLNSASQGSSTDLVREHVYRTSGFVGRDAVLTSFALCSQPLCTIERKCWTESGRREGPIEKFWLESYLEDFCLLPYCFKATFNCVFFFYFKTQF